MLVKGIENSNHSHFSFASNPLFKSFVLGKQSKKYFSERRCEEEGYGIWYYTLHVTLFKHLCVSFEQTILIPEAPLKRMTVMFLISLFQNVLCVSVP